MHLVSLIAADWRSVHVVQAGEEVCSRASFVYVELKLVVILAMSIAVLHATRRDNRRSFRSFQRHADRLVG